MSKKKKIWTGVIAGILVIAAIAAAVLQTRMPQDEVFVYSYDMVGYTNFYQNGSESYGMVTTDRVQTAYVTDTQTVEEILVYQGQKVKKGDVLYRYDTTLSDLEVEKKELSIKQMELNLSNAQEELKALNKMKAMVIPNEPTSSTTNQSSNVKKSPKDTKIEPGEIYNADTAKGTSSRPYRVWLKKTSYVTEDMIYEYLKTKDAQMKSEVYVVFGVVNSRDKEFEQEYGVRYMLVDKVSSGTGVSVAAYTETQEEDPDTGSTDPTQTDPTVTDPTQPPETEATEPTTAPTTEPETDPTQPPETEATEPTTEPTTEPAEPEKVIEMRFFQPSASAQEDDKEIIWNSGYTSSELKAMKAEKNEQISDLKFDIKMAKAELKILEKEVDSGEVVAQFDGTVVSVLEPQNALETNTPMIKVAGGGGFYVEGAVSELDLATIQVGQSVTVTSWDTYQTYEGTVTEIGSYPAEDGNYFSYGMNNVSYYPYKVFIDQSADLQEGFYVSMVYQSEPVEEGSGTMYLENAFLRTENGESYVYVRGEEGLLEKRTVQVGDNSDGYMAEILSGLNDTDYLAFPYGKNVVEGAPTVEGTWEDLYGY